jgi:hypothetical protein
MPIEDLLSELRDELLLQDVTLSDTATFEVWCARVRSMVSTSFPSKLATLDRTLNNFPTTAVPRLAPRPVIGSGPAASAGNGSRSRKGMKGRLVAFLDQLALKSEPDLSKGAATPQQTVATWKPTPWVFISSVRADAEAYRNSARNACLRKKMLPVGMESWSASTHPSIEVCRNNVRQCDLVVLLLLHRYGSVEPQSGKAYTELEYEAARASGKDILAFDLTIPPGVEATQIDLEDLRRLQAFVKSTQHLLRGRASTPEELEMAVLQALDEWQSASRG